MVIKRAKITDANRFLVYMCVFCLQQKMPFWDLLLIDKKVRTRAPAMAVMVAGFKLLNGVLEVE